MTTVAFETITIHSACDSFMSDLITPVAVYQKIRAVNPLCCLLESVQQNESIGRYSVIGFSPLISFSGKGNICTIRMKNHTQTITGNPFDVLRDLTGALKYDMTNPERTPLWIGYLGYDMIRHIETIPDKNPDELDIPECFLMIPSRVISFDHIRQVVDILTYSIDGDPATESETDAILSLLKNADSAKLNPVKEAVKVFPHLYTSNKTREEYEQIVVKTKDYIKAGDIFQGVLSQRFEMPYERDAFEIYRALRRINPSPYLYHLAFKDFSIVGSSPEMLVRLEGEKITIRPIAGTVRRGATEAEDKVLETELLADPKELAEHMMLIDLARNDIGRVSIPGSVTPEKTLFVENYSHVKHIVSSITGKLAPAYDAIDLIKAVFPAGTLSGTPKIRAMEIIDELESTRRGIYGGSIIFWRLPDMLNSCIIIRSVLVKDGKAYVQAGAGIVADSVPEREYEETVKKASAVISAVAGASAG